MPLEITMDIGIDVALSKLTHFNSIDAFYIINYLLHSFLTLCVRCTTVES